MLLVKLITQFCLLYFFVFHLPFLLTGSTLEENVDKNLYLVVSACVVTQYAIHCPPSLSLLMAHLSSALACHLIIILFGAPVFELLSRTCCLSILFSALVVLPMYTQLLTPCRILWEKTSVANWHTLTLIEKQLVMHMLCSSAGLYLGALPIPLDWDRPWQVRRPKCIFPFSYERSFLKTQTTLAMAFNVSIWTRGFTINCGRNMLVSLLDGRWSFTFQSSVKRSC